MTAAALREEGGLVVRIERPGRVLAVESHASEAHELPADAVLVNDATPDALRARLVSYIAQATPSAAA